MEGEGDLSRKGSPSPVSYPSFPNLTSPYAEAIDDELGDLLMLGLARAFDAHGRAEFKVDGLFDIHRAEIFEEVPVPPRIGLERHRNDRNPGALGKLDADGIEMRGVENGTARALRKNNDGTALQRQDFAAGRPF